MNIDRSTLFQCIKKKQELATKHQEAAVRERRYGMAQFYEGKREALDEVFEMVFGWPNNKWTVLLLRPDYVADVFGQDTIMLHVGAKTHSDALAVARAEALKIDKQDGESEDYFPLLVTTGWINDEQAKSRP